MIWYQTFVGYEYPRIKQQGSSQQELESNEVVNYTYIKALDTYSTMEMIPNTNRVIIQLKDTYHKDNTTQNSNKILQFHQKHVMSQS